MVDTKRMKRVLDRLPPPPVPPPMPPRPDPRPEPPPPPPEPRLEELACRERALSELTRALMRRSRPLRNALPPVVRASEQRRRTLEREWFLNTGERLPPSPPPPAGRGRREGVLTLLRRAWCMAGELAREYAALAEREPDRRRRQVFRELDRSAGESERLLRRLLEQATR